MRPIILALLFFGFHVSVDASQLSVVRLFSEITYETHIAGGLFSRDRSLEFSSVTQGSGFVLTTRDGPYIVTAAHVLVGPSQLSGVGEGKNFVDLNSPRATLVGHSFRVRVGELSLRPTAFFLDRDRDVAVLSLSAEHWTQVRVPGFSLRSSGPVPVRSDVTVYGFPGRASAAMLHTARVAEVQREFFSLDRSLGAGFSGGPVVDSRNRLIGMISRSTETHTRAVSMNVIEDIMRDLSSKMLPLAEPHFVYTK